MPDADEDRQIREAGFRGYYGCPHLEAPEGCPTAYLCSERGSCRAEAVALGLVEEKAACPSVDCTANTVDQEPCLVCPDRVVEIEAGPGAGARIREVMENFEVERVRTEPEVVAIASIALFESDLWQAWCGDELRIIDDQGRLARIETARVVLDSVPPGWLKTDDGWQKIVLEAGE